MQKIRFLQTGFGAGAWNMAVDEVLLHSLSQNNKTSGFLRFYQWRPATLSFGYNQKISRLLELAKAREAGYGMVKRASGGKMVFHADEWTFSLGFRLNELHDSENKTFLDGFFRALKPMLQGLNDIGVPARFSEPKEVKRHSQNKIHCFAAAAGHSIFAGEKKLIGAAGQVKNGCLGIHGSIPISVSFPDSEVFLQNRKIDDGVSMTCLQDFLDARTIKLFPEIIAQKYAEIFATSVINSPLSADETEQSKLIEQKYADLNWKRC
jgi:lipoate-protein ligase A